MAKAQEKQKDYYDRKRSNVTFKTGDMVMLNARHLKLRLYNLGVEINKLKLLAKKIGPFEIEAMINNNVTKLVLPRNLHKPHQSFNTLLLSYYVPDPTIFGERTVPKAVPVLLNE